MTGKIFKIKDLKNNKRSQRFFQRSAEYVGKNILGDFLVLKDGKHRLIGKIVETESYFGVNDDASHSFNGKITPRNKVMYAAGCAIYVYFIYGMHWCFNVVTSKKDDPQAVLIRALEPISGIEILKKRRGIDNITKLTSGPCRWTQAFGIDRSFQGKSILKDEIFIARAANKKFDIVETKRIGIDYAVNTKHLPLRFYIKNNPFISKK